MQTAPTVHCTPLFCISPYSMHLVCSAVVVVFEIFKDIFKIIFFMLQQTIPLYLACEKALDVKTT